MKIVSWNIQQGGGSRIKEIAAYLRKNSADIIVLSEFRSNRAGKYLRKILLDVGYWHQAAPGTESQVNAVLVASKFAFDLRRYDHLLFGHGLLSCQFSAFELVGCYLPHKKKHQLFEVLLEKSRSAQELIVAGDLNSGKNFVDQQGDSFWYTAEMSDLMQSGMVDAYRHLHGDKRDYSWYSHRGNGFRYDHTLVSFGLQPLIKSCDYDHKVRTDGLSDHSLMWLELG